MNFFETLILGLVEGITEFLPISSTAHLDITRIILAIPETSFIKSFEIVIQLGAILAVVFLYKKKFFYSWIYFRNVMIAFVPTGIIGFILYKIIKNILLSNTLVIALALILGGVFIIFFEKRKTNEENSEKKIETLSMKELLMIGCSQALAVVPGVSRSLAVIVSGNLIGLSRTFIVEFSFLLAIPTMISATAYDLYKSGLYFSNENWVIIGFGFIISFMTAIFIVKWLIRYVQKNSFTIFGWYRIILGGGLLVFVLT